MKLLHSKSTAEPILAVSACPCTNLFGLVTFSTITVYRSTTLTTVFTFALSSLLSFSSGDANEASLHRQAEHYRCCWSPSGRLFTVSLPSGLILIFDVEGGSLVRVFTAGSSSNTSPVTADDAFSAAAPSSAVGAAAPAAPGSPSSPSSSTFPTSVPWVATSLPPGSPLLAMTWCSVPSLSSMLLSTMSAEVQTRCLPVRLGVAAALFDEATQENATCSAGGAVLGADAAAGWGCDYGDAGGRDEEDEEATSNATATSVSMLLVLGRDGVLRCLVGGLYEVCSVPLALPLPLAHGGCTWKDVQIQDIQLRQSAAGSGETESSSGAAQFRFAALIAFGDTALEPVQPAVEQHHCLYLTVRESAMNSNLGNNERERPSRLPSQALWETCLGDRLTSLAMPQWLAGCYVREYARIAQETYEKALYSWRGVLGGRVLANLGLPAAAPLLATALVAQLTDPDPIELYRYAKQTLMRAALADDLEAMAKMLRIVSYEVTHVCYRCCEAAMAYAVYVPDSRGADSCDAIRDALSAPSSTSSVSVVAQLGMLRRRYEAFVQQAASDGECARDLALWVLQQSIHWESGTHFVMTSANGRPATGGASGGYAEEDRQDAPAYSAGGRAGSPTPLEQPPLSQQPMLIDEVPVSATRQPALFSFLLEMISESSAFATGSSAKLSGTQRTAGFEDDSSGSSRSDTATRVYKELSSRALRPAATPGVSASPPPLACTVLVGHRAAEGASALLCKDAQLLCCCVVEGTTSGVEVGGAASSASEAESDRDGNEAFCDAGEKEEAAEGSAFADSAVRQAAGAPYIHSQSVKVYTLQSSRSESSGVAPLRLSASTLLRQTNDGLYCSENKVGNEEAAAGESGVMMASELTELNAADVDIASIASHLRADFTQDQGAAFCSSWYGFLEEDRHVLVCQPASVLARTDSGGGGGTAVKAAAPFFVAVLQDDGAIVVADAKEEEEEEEEDEEAEDDCSATGIQASPSRVALCQVAGMEGVPLRVSMSRARSFCVIVAVAKYIVMSLYDDDY